VVYDTKHLAAKFHLKPSSPVDPVDPVAAAVVADDATSAAAAVVVKSAQRFPNTSLGDVYATLKAEVRTLQASICFKSLSLATDSLPLIQLCCTA
jgi:hypothetical protein